ncbi:hypothetical protein B7R21_19490 [Subtercola boreus]|uniref:Ketoreductase domain-containing protein n=1 Tax=Subtercola boreus TaxID=120213 RepID=A0A3E0VA46_9MICO|nr:SDR family NAD(P)-dependent oxidoreductase [Subtercola boreus]RFA06579.1 hypothetical protein B7R21_19490 [Subtercola boreus]
MTETMNPGFVIVTGGSSGIGAQITRDYRAAGARVAVVDLRPPAISSGEEYFHCDITNADDVASVVGRIAQLFGQIDLLVNNAGYVTRGAADEISEEDWDKTFAINVKGTFLMTKASLPYLKQSPDGSIVNVASQAGIRAEALLSPYCAAKAAIVHYTRALALELAPAVRVNAVCPGFVETDMARKSLEEVARETDRAFAEVRTERMSVIPMQRFQQPSDISAAVRFFASREAREITGEVMSVAGGQTL